MSYQKDHEDAVKFRDSIHQQALDRIHQRYPEVDHVIDRHPVDDYISQYWDYPGAWYTRIGIPDSFKSRDDCIDTLVRDTIKQLKGK